MVGAAATLSGVTASIYVDVFVVILNDYNYNSERLCP